MIGKALQLFFFWRRNNLPSILFKSFVWSVIAWLAVGMFTNVRLALVAGAAIALMSAIKYALQRRQETQRLLAMVDGDKQKYKALRAKLDAPGMGGTLMRELLNAEMHDCDECDDDEQDISDEQRQININDAQRRISAIRSVCTAEGLLSEAQCDDAQTELMECYGDGEETLELDTLIEAFLPDNVLGICMEDYINEDDHASLVDMFAEATNGRWVIEDSSSRYDESAERWVVSFTEAGKSKSWRFSQRGDWLSSQFLDQLINYTQARSGYQITILDSEDYVSMVCLPPAVHAAVVEGALDQAA